MRPRSRGRHTSPAIVLQLCEGQSDEAKVKLREDHKRCSVKQFILHVNQVIYKVKH